VAGTSLFRFTPRVDANGFSTPELPPALLELGRSVLEGDLELDPRGAELRGDLYWIVECVAPFAADRHAAVTDLEANAPRYRAAAEAWLARHRDHPWFAPFGGDRQGWVCGDVDEPPDPGVFVPPPAPEYTPFGCTLLGATTTTLDDGDMWPVPWERRTAPGAPVWALTVPRSARVLEIRDPAGWAELVTAHPRPLTAMDEPLYDLTLPGGLLGVDWASAARDWDGVRMTFDGILRTAYVAVPVPGGTTAFMPWDSGWEQTLWLRWVFDDAIPGTPWRRPDG